MEILDPHLPGPGLAGRCSRAARGNGVGYERQERGTNRVCLWLHSGRRARRGLRERWRTIPAGANGVHPPPLPLSPTSERGASITPAYEGWFQNQDGTYSLLVGYFNRNRSQALDIPVGPNNRIEPGPIDQGQPTHFAVGRNWGVFVIKVPADFGTKTVTWTIVSNGESQTIPFTLNKAYVVEPYQEAGMGNKPPEFRFDPGGPVFAGPPTGVFVGRTASS